MAKVRKAQGDFGRIVTLDKTLITGTQDIANGNPLVLQATLDEIELFIPGYKTAYNTVKEKLNARMKVVRESAVSMENLKLHILDIWEAVRRRNKRMGLPAEIFNYYGLPLDGTNPRLSVREEWLQIGREMVSGDANAVADGNPAILNPSAPELQTAINKAQDDLDKIALADRAYDLAQAAVAEFRPRADEFIDEVFDQLLFALRKMDNPSQRRVIRSYGYKYDYSPDEPPEEVPDKPEEFDIRWEEPQVTVGCEEINTAVTYEFVYSLGDDNWLPLYTGAEHSYTYDPPAGRRMYKVRAENEIGAGEWSDELEFTVPG